MFSRNSCNPSLRSGLARRFFQLATGLTLRLMSSRARDTGRQKKSARLMRRSKKNRATRTTRLEMIPPNNSDTAVVSVCSTSAVSSINVLLRSLRFFFPK